LVGMATVPGLNFCSYLHCEKQCCVPFYCGVQKF